MTGSTVTVGTSGKSLEFYEANKTILLDLNSTLDVSGSIYAKNHDSTYAGTINISTTGLGEASKNTYQLLIVGGSISTSEVTVNIDGSSISGYSDNSVYSGDYKFTTLGGHGVYLTKLDNSTVYLDPAYTRIGQKPNGNDNLLIGLNAKNNISVVGAATSQIYLTKGNDSTSSYGNLNLSSQEVNTTITTTGGLGKCRLPRLLDDERGS